MTQIKALLLIYFLLSICSFASDNEGTGLYIEDAVDSWPELAKKLQDARIKNVKIYRTFVNDDREYAFAICNNETAQLQSSLEIIEKMLSDEDLWRWVGALIVTTKKRVAFVVRLTIEREPFTPELESEIKSNKMNSITIEEALQAKLQLLAYKHFPEYSYSLSSPFSLYLWLPKVNYGRQPFKLFNIKDQYFFFFDIPLGNEANTVKNAELECCSNTVRIKFPITLNYLDNSLTATIGVVVIPNEKFIPPSKRQPENVLEFYLCSGDLPTELIETILKKLYFEDNQEIAAFIKFEHSGLTKKRLKQ